MPSEPNAINYLLSGALGAVISGFILLINNYLNNKSQSEREEKQRTWQLEREEKQRIFQQKNEQEKLYRERIYDSYRKVIYLLTEMMQMQFEAEKNYLIENKEIKGHKVSLELISEFNIIVHSYLSKDFEDKDFKNKDYKRFQEKIDQFNEVLNTNPLEALSILTDMMENDSRIKNINN